MTPPPLTHVAHAAAHDSEPRPAPVAAMHTVDDDAARLVADVFDYARRRALHPSVPLDRPQSPADLRRLAGGSIRAEGIGARRALGVFEHVLAPACISTDHPAYLSFIPSAPTKAALAFDVVVSASAIYGGSWMEGAGAVHAENEVLAWLAAEFGMPATAGGVFVQGGTIGNLSALVAAREQARSRRRDAGKRMPHRWAVVCSAEAHSSIASAAAVMDVDVVPASVDDSGRLRGEAVEEAIASSAGEVFAVVATAGTTNLGIVDDIGSVAVVARNHGAWLHIDGAYGLAAMLAPSTRPLFAGVEHADSLIVDPHKWLFAPFDACALLYRDPAIAFAAHTQKAGYLDTLTESADWNPSDLAIQLTRRARGLPLWFSLAVHGTDRYRQAIEDALARTRRVADEIRRRPELELVREPDLSVVAFRRAGWVRADYEAWSDRLLDEQRAFVVPSSHDGQPILRFAIISPLTSDAILWDVLDTLR